MGATAVWNVGGEAAVERVVDGAATLSHLSCLQWRKSRDNLTPLRALSGAPGQLQAASRKRIAHIRIACL